MEKQYNRVIELSEYILKTNKTIRQIAYDYDISKSTVHNDLSYKLKKYNYNLYLKVKNILTQHDKIKHIKGGLATKEKYKSLK